MIQAVLRLAKNEDVADATGPETVASSVTSIAPSGNNGAVGMNLLRAVSHNGDGQVKLLDIDIKKTLEKLEQLRRDRVFTLLITEIAQEYHAGAEQPSGKYTLDCAMKFTE